MSEQLNWANLPNVPQVMLEFAAQNDSVIDLLGGDYRSAAARRIARDRRLKHSIPDGLGEALRQGYGGMDLSPAIEANLVRLDQPGTLAIVTGQQAGLFGGPLYTTYKALSAIRLARQLSEETDGPVVPLFWMETADSDFGEVNRIAFPPLSGTPRRALYAPRDVVAGRSISLHRLMPEIDAAIAEVDVWIENAPHRDRVVELIRSAYQPGEFIADAFRRMMNELFGARGLVLVDPRHPALIERSIPFWQKALARPEKLNQSFAASSRSLALLHLPLQVYLRDDALPVMHHGDDGVRRRLQGESGVWRAGPEGEPITSDDLKKLAAREPHRFSPSALLRPLLQDYLLPTWIYVGGPAEISYQAQIGLAYELLEIGRPLVAARSGFTLVERPVRRYLDKHNWTVADAMGGREMLLRRRGSGEALASLFDSGMAHLEGWLKRIEQAAEEAEVAIATELDQAGRKMTYQWGKLKSLALTRIESRDLTRLRHADFVIEHLLPDEVLQERHDSPLYYIAHYGDQFISALSEKVNLLAPRHYVIELGD
ncbi:MAG: bacillithiol biosynthesis cysteine-adding enzyme BshC [Calditrichaeota bacterium]|nr:bacillithiol biosynthesis cysteine-adding enzyme BshC [Calditrichota bacterium]